MKVKTLPKTNDFQAFYIYAGEMPLNLMSRELAEQQNVAWETGTHTSTPVGQQLMDSIK